MQLTETDSVCVCCYLHLHVRVCVCLCVSAACLYWIYLWEAPLELGLVMLMVSLQLDWLAALAGVSTAFLLVPMQVGTTALLSHPCSHTAEPEAVESN